MSKKQRQSVLLTILLLFLPRFRTHQNIGRQRAKGKFDKYIVGGSMARIQSHPHSVFLAIHCHKDDDFNDFACGASVLNQVMLLSAGHCFEECETDGTIITGSVGNANKHQRKDFKTASFEIHPDYDESDMKNDIALAVLKEPLKFNKVVKRVALTDVGIYNEPAVLAGWGITDEEKHTETLYLKATRQEVLSRAECLEINPEMDSGFLCALPEVGTPFSGYAAVGDSGSALVVRGYVQIGLVSHKISEISKTLIMYTDVSKYYDWIEDTSKALYCSTRGEQQKKRKQKKSNFEPFG